MQQIKINILSSSKQSQLSQSFDHPANTSQDIPTHTSQDIPHPCLMGDPELEQNFHHYVNMVNLKEGSIQGRFDQLKSILQIFGIPYLDAPGEAEAQCAFLETSGLVDGVISDDSDCFLFGARRVYRHFFKRHSEIECYDSRLIGSELGLSRE